MITHENIIQTIFEAMDEVNERQPENQQLNKSPNTILFGKDGKLDSLGLVNLVVATEQRIEEKYCVTISLADDRAMSEKNSPFKNVQTLGDYIAKLLTEMTNA